MVITNHPNQDSTGDPAGRTTQPTPRVSAAQWRIVGFTALYMAVALVAALVRKNPEFIFYLVVMAVLIGVTTLVHLRSPLSNGALWGLSLWGLAHLAGGLMPIPEHWPILGETHVLYNWWLIPEWIKYDQVVHAYGFGVMTWVCWQGLQQAMSAYQVRPRPTLGLMVLCVAGGMGFGAANEVVEFIATQTLPDTNVGGYENTGWDLVANLVGCTLAAALIAGCSGRTVD